MPALREAIASRCSRKDPGVTAENVLVTTGSQQALDLIGRVFIDAGDTVVVERPTYVGALQAWNTCSARYHSVELDGDGMRIDPLESATARAAKFIYTIPTFHNPTGAVMSGERRRGLVHLASWLGVPIVEDDPYGALRYDGEVVESLFVTDRQERRAAGDRAGNVLYLGTFSKLLAPGLRVGWVVGPAEVIAQLGQAKQSADLHTSAFAQLLALEMLKTGFLDDHVVRLRREYTVRRDAMLAAMSASFPASVNWTRPSGGLYVWATLPDHVDAADVLQYALSKKVAFVPGASFFPEGGGAASMRLNFTHASPDLIREGISRLGQVIGDMVHRARPVMAHAAPAATRRGTGADAIAATLAALGVRHVFGVGGANIEDLYLAVQKRRPEMMAVLDKHEHSAGTAADAYARVSRSLGVVMTTSGGGAANLVSALAESRASYVPVLAIVGEPPIPLQGRGAFQDTSGLGRSVDVRRVFAGVSVWCERARSAADLPVLVEAATRAALQHSAPAVLLVAKDLQQATVDFAADRQTDLRVQPPSAPEPEALHQASDLLRNASVVVIAGDEVARAGVQDDLRTLAVALNARVAVTPDARDAFDNLDPLFSGVAGAMGHEDAARAIAGADVYLLVGTRLPLVARQGHEAFLEAKPVISIAREAPFVVSRRAIHLTGSLGHVLRALRSELVDAARRTVAPTAPPARESSQVATSFGSEGILQAIERATPEDGVVLIDAGNTGAHAVHYLRSPRHGHWLVAMGMAGMGYTFGAAIGAAFSSGRRTLVLAGDGAFFMHGLEIHTAVQHQLPITYVIFNNKAHGMCLVRERLLLGQESGYNVFRDSQIGKGLAAIFPGLRASDCTSLQELEQALASAGDGPVVICAELPGIEIPPFVAFKAALAARTTAERGAPRT